MVVSAPAPDGGRKKSPYLCKQDISSCRTRLLELMQRINFGQVFGLVVRDREPILDPSPRKAVEIKFGGENGPRPEAGTRDFVLKSQVVELFTFFDELQNGVIDVLEVKHGLPFRLIVTEAAA